MFLRLFERLNLSCSTRFVSSVSYSASKQRRKRRSVGDEPFKANVGLRHQLNTVKEEGIKYSDKLDIDSFDNDDESDYDKEILQANKTFDQFCQEEEVRHKKVLHNIIKRKYFKSLPEPTLLTWAAKEQLRYLHDTDPKTWTPEKLANSFPISVEGVKKLLKSSYHPETDDEIMKHDRKVLKNWKRLKAGEGPIATAVGQELSSGKINFESLDGDQTLPVPTEKWKQRYLPQSKMVKADRNSLPGEFESLVKDCRDLTLKPDTDAPNNASSLDGEEINYEHVPHISAQNFNKQPKSVSFEEFKEQMRKKLKSSTDNLQAYDKFEDWLDRNEAPRAAAFKLASVIKTDEYSDRFDDIKGYFEGKIQKFKDPPSLNMKWDVHRDTKNPQGKEAYIYEQGRGYQRPYGRYEEIERIEITEELRHSEGIYQKGNCYYDENGELLYRVP